MFMPVNPNSAEGMWDKLQESLTRQSICLVISQGKLNVDNTAKSLSEYEAELFTIQLKGRDYVRVGCSRLNPMPAHFSIDISECVGRVMELVSLALDDENLRRDMSLVCQFAFYENKDMNALVLPCIVHGLEDPDLIFKINESSGITIAYRK
ncbi:hypothetical protein [Enterovibrio norvegicus]|uniref:hypothetical protein n=1 Tax=Enterovibrio norvegicus TaxID=188144 RepID=UPI0013D06EE6|nr:hypothetical protein [Enterovibrio norvegicus]